MIPPQSARTSTFLPRQLTPQQGVNSTGWGDRVSRGWGYCISPGWCHKEGSAAPKKDGVCRWYGRGTHTGILVAVPSTLSLEPQTPVSPHTTMVWSSLPLPEPRVRGWKWDFVCWRFKSVPVFLADSHLSLHDRIPVDFHSQISCGWLFLALVLWAEDPIVELTPHVEHLQLQYPSGISASSHGSRARPYCLSILPTSLDVASIKFWL